MGTSVDSMDGRTLKWRAAAAVIAGALMVAACGGSDDAPAAETAYEVVTEPTWGPGDAPPAASGDIVLAVSGMLDDVPAGGSAALDLAALEALGVVQYEVDDRTATGEVAMFSGVLLEDLLDALGVSDDATTLRATALDDYSVEIPMTDVRSYPVLIATAMNGQRMAVENYGPTRVIYPTHAYDLPSTTYDPRLIWQLKSIEVA